MKKLFVLFAATMLVAVFAGTTIAAEWNFYGSARMGYWRYSDDDSNPATTNDPDYSLFKMNNNSRYGARVKDKDRHLSGRLETAVQRSGSGKPSTTGAGNIALRHFYGEWDFGPGKLRIGQTNTVLDLGLTTMAGEPDAQNGDEANAYTGALYNSRRAQIALLFGGFTIMASEPTGDNGIITGVNAATGAPIRTGRVENTLPQIGIKYNFKMDPVDLTASVAYLTYDVVGAAGATEDLTVDAYAGGIQAKFNLGPFNLMLMYALCQNANELGIIYSTRRDNPMNSAWQNGALINSTGRGVVDTSSTSFAAFGTFKLSDMIQFGAGYSYIKTEYDSDPVVTAAGITGKDDNVCYYGQAIITLSKGVFIVPEIGMLDYKKDIMDNDSGDRTYFGAKFQIDF